MKISLQKQISIVINNPKLISGELVQILMGASNIVIEREKREMPVDRGGMRNSVRIIRKSNDSIDIAPTAIGIRGAPYPAYLHGGTGKYRNAPDAGYTTGRVRAGRMYDFKTRKKLQIFFASLAKRGYKFSIRPNKFADRTYMATKSPVLQFVGKELNKLVTK